MKEVGDKFGVRRADPAVRAAVGRGDEAGRVAPRAVPREGRGRGKGRVVLATVYGDVHDIGKNLIKTILANNGYSVHDLGKQVPVNDDRGPAVGSEGRRDRPVGAARVDLAADAARRARARSARPGDPGARRRRGHQPRVRPRHHVHRRAAPTPAACSTAATRSRGSRRWTASSNPDTRRNCSTASAGRRRCAGSRVAPDAETIVRSSVETRRRPTCPTPPFWGARTVRVAAAGRGVPAPRTRRGCSRRRGAAAGRRAAATRADGQGARAGEARVEGLRAEFVERLARMKQEAAADGWLAPPAVYGYFPAQADGNELVVFDPADHSKVLVRFAFPRQRGRGPAVPGRLLPARSARRGWTSWRCRW